MNTSDLIFRGIFGCVLLVVALLTVGEGRAAPEGAIRSLVLTGGHDFAWEPFFQMFRSFEGITYREAKHPEAEKEYTREAARDYDVLVLYDMWEPISEAGKRDFLALLQEGKGLVVLHHALCSYQAWDEYARVVGGRYHLKAREINGERKVASGYQHDVRFTVRVADRTHPVTRGADDFELFDETYRDFEVLPGVKPLLTTNASTSGKTIAWAHTYGKSRVVFIQPGHGPEAYAHPSYRKLVAQAIRWAAQQD
jgi:uncharacterized protein